MKLKWLCQEIITSIDPQTRHIITDRSLVGEPMSIIYDPRDLNIALINNFQECWLEPITRSAP